jgi:hypothetical protein
MPDTFCYRHARSHISRGMRALEYQVRIFHGLRRTQLRREMTSPHMPPKAYLSG